jgi:hypothetical protein
MAPRNSCTPTTLVKRRLQTIDCNRRFTTVTFADPDEELTVAIG